MIRFILCVIVVVGFLILSIPILLVEWIIGKFNPMAKEISSLRIVQAVFRFILWVAGVKLTVLGEENVPKDIPVLYIGNHRSFFDVPLTYPRCPIRTGYIAKKEMEKVPLLSTWMKRLHCLFLDRKDLKQGLKTILTAIEKIKSGISICIFPEGTRNKNEDELDMLPFHEGSFKVAVKANCHSHGHQRFRRYLGSAFSKDQKDPRHPGIWKANLRRSAGKRGEKAPGSLYPEHHS